MTRILLTIWMGLTLGLTGGCAGKEMRPGLEMAFQTDNTRVPLYASAVQERMVLAAEQQSGKEIERTTLMDLAFPRDQEEYEKMNGFGLLWITALAHNPDDLPLRNVRLFTRWVGIVHLNPVVSFITRETDRRVTETLGEHRFDGVFLLPLHAETLGSEVVADFQENRTHFILGDLRDIPPPSITTLTSISSGGVFPDGDTITRMVQREYPITSEVAARKYRQKAEVAATEAP